MSLALDSLVLITFLASVVAPPRGFDIRDKQSRCNKKGEHVEMIPRSRGKLSLYSISNFQAESWPEKWSERPFGTMILIGEGDAVQAWLGVNDNKTACLLKSTEI
jgi:hypothetical protein